MHKHSLREGFILLLTLLLLAIGIIASTQFFQRGQSHVFLDQVFVEREKAKTLALNGIALAISRLSILDTNQSSGEKPKPEENKLEERIFALVPAINRRQDFVLQEKIEGVNGTIALCIGCEEGKININEMYDFKQKKFKGEGALQGDMRKVMQEVFVLMKPFTQDKNLFDAFENFLKKRDFPLNDATELLNVPEFQQAFKDNIFYEPIAQLSKKKRPIFLTDIFTTFPSTVRLQPWLLSDSLSAILSLKRAEPDDITKRAKEIKVILKDTTPKQTIEQIWDKQLQPLFGKEFKTISQYVTSLFDTKFEASVFCVLCYGISGEIKQKVFAIINKSVNKATNRAEFTVKKIYWL